MLQVIGTLYDRLSLAARRHQRLHHAGEANLLGSLLQLIKGLGVEVARRLQSQLLGSQVTDGLAVHRIVDGLGTGHHLDAFAFKVIKTLRANSLNLRHNQVGLVPTYGSLQGIAVEHAEHFTLIGHLHGGCTGIRIARHDILSQPLGGNHKLLAQFTRAQQ